MQVNLEEPLAEYLHTPNAPPDAHEGHGEDQDHGEHFWHFLF